MKVRHLLSMNSGLPSHWAPMKDELPLAKAAEEIARAPLAATPGARFIY
jgi:CubicO group peptidase (beta-lactamase class C family)